MKIVLSVIFSFTIIAITSATQLAAPKIKAPKTVTIPKCGKKKPPVVFDHQKHAKTLKTPCKTCHHKEKFDKPCASCHAGKAKGKKPGCAEMSLKKNPYHITCINCHKIKRQGPRKCNQCHVKSASNP